jgi:hypothetical protein
MPRVVNRHPAYRRHRASGQALVTLNGEDRYLGPYGTKTGRAEYDRLIAEWLSRGKKAAPRADEITVIELIDAFLEHAEGYYRGADGKPASEYGNLCDALRPVKRLYGLTPAAGFGPLALRAVRDEMVKLGWCRSHINRQVNRVRHVFKWAAGRELLPAAVHAACGAIEQIGLPDQKAMAAEMKRRPDLRDQIRDVKEIAADSVKRVAEELKCAMGEAHAVEVLSQWEGFGRFCRKHLGREPLTEVRAWRLGDDDPAAEVVAAYPEATVDEAKAAHWEANWAREWERRFGLR